MPHKFRKKKPPHLTVISSISSSSSQPLHSSDPDQLSNDITKQVETTLHIEENNPVEPPLLQLSVNDTTSVQEQEKTIDPITPKESSFRKRIRAFTTSSAKSSTEPNRHSWESKSSSTRSPCVRSDSFRDSLTTQSTNSPELSPIAAPGITQSPKGKKRSNEGTSPRKVFAPPSVLKYIRSPHDYMFIDLDFIESQIMDNRLNSGVLPSGDASGETRTPEVGRSSFDELIKYVRRVTGTETRTESATYPGFAKRPNDVRAWDHKNLWCISCRGPCPICDTPCCLLAETRLNASNENLNAEEVEQAKRLAKIIEYLNVHAKDADTFALCSPPDGCGRHVCPSCCGVCPNEICRDIQCKVNATYTLQFKYLRLSC